MVYYNENDPKLVSWLRGMIENKQLPYGVVDDRSIEDVKPSELFEYDRCHFFAGIAGWALALAQAEAKGCKFKTPIWTGSCPCQPFSTSGKRKGFADHRHLYPQWEWHIKQCRPATIFGEQVASNFGKDWLSHVFNSLEKLDFAMWATDLCAASVGSPQIRQRLYFCAKDNRLEHCDSKRTQRHINTQAEKIRPSSNIPLKHASTDCLSRVSNTEGNSNKPLSIFNRERGREGQGLRSFWYRKNGEYPAYLQFKDGKARPIEPRISPLADGVSHRMVKLRGYGNAIVPQVAQAFILASYH